MHGNRFILHLVFRVLDTYDSVSEIEFEKMKEGIPQITLEMLAQTTAEKETQAKGSYPANVFKNASKCKGLAEAILPAKAGSALTLLVRAFSFASFALVFGFLAVDFCFRHGDNSTGELTEALKRR